MCPLLWAQQSPHDPVGEALFPPELVMQHQQAIGLTEEQAKAIRSEVEKAQGHFSGLQWQLEREMETLVSLLQQERPDETLVLAQLDKLLPVERDIKRAHLELLMRIKATLTAEQQAKLQALKRKPESGAAHTEPSEHPTAR